MKQTDKRIIDFSSFLCYNNRSTLKITVKGELKDE